MTTLLPGEVPNILEELRTVMEQPEEWLQLPCALLGGQRPSELLDTPDEEALRDIVRSLKHGTIS